MQNKQGIRSLVLHAALTHNASAAFFPFCMNGYETKSHVATRVCVLPLTQTVIDILIE